MTITISLMWAILMLMVLSAVLEHLINWGYRKAGNSGLLVLIPCFHLMKWTILIGILGYILK